MEEVTGRLEAWYWDPNCNMIWGYLYDDIHKRWTNGTHIHTSHVTSHSMNSKTVPAKKGDIVTTLNSRYLLGEPL